MSFKTVFIISIFQFLIVANIILVFENFTVFIKNVIFATDIFIIN